MQLFVHLQDQTDQTTSLNLGSNRLVKAHVCFDSPRPSHLCQASSTSGSTFVVVWTKAGWHLDSDHTGSLSVHCRIVSMIIQLLLLQIQAYCL